MGSKRAMDLALSCTTLLLMAGFASSDLAQDRAECADQLVGLANCLPYVRGDAKTPTLDCCTGLKQVLDKSKKCICILIKDRNDPNIGIKINTTLAIQLPSVCHAPANISECVTLLHLAPNSPEAKVFEGLENTSKSNSSTPVPSANSGTGNASSSSSDTKSDGGWGKRRLVAEVGCGILPFVFISHTIFLV